MKLVLVQTPSQAKTLADVLGDGWRVEPCYSMVRELPTDKLGIRVDDDFRPTFTLAPGKGNLVRRLMKAIRACDAVYVATPPSRDGEALAWHVLALSPDAKLKPVYRIRLNALTPAAIRAAFAAPGRLDVRQIEAHTTRRMIERLAGWSLSAAARKATGLKIALTFGGLVGLRVCAEREIELAACTPQTGWRASVALEHDGVRFTAPVLNAKGAPLTLRHQEQVAQLETLLKHGQFWVDKSGQVMKTCPAPDALTLRTLIETAERDLHLTPERVLSLVETLYEAGWITHPDGTPAADASEAASAYIRREYGSDYVAPDGETRMGIAPATVERVPEDRPGDGAALYGLIWRRFIAAHMPPAQERLTLARILVGASQTQRYPIQLRAAAKRLVFDGWLRLLPAPENDETTAPLTEGETLVFQQVVTDLVTGEAPVRHTRGSLVSALVNQGFTVQAALTAVHGLLTAEYVVGDESLTLTERGRVLADYLADANDALLSPMFAAELTADMDRIASGEQEWRPILRSFWARFGSTLRPIPAAHAVREHKPIVLRPAEEV